MQFQRFLANVPRTLAFFDTGTTGLHLGKDQHRSMSIITVTPNKNPKLTDLLGSGYSTDSRDYKFRFDAKLEPFAPHNPIKIEKERKEQQDCPNLKESFPEILKFVNHPTTGVDFVGWNLYKFEFPLIQRDCLGLFDYGNDIKIGGIDLMRIDAFLRSNGKRPQHRKLIEAYKDLFNEDLSNPHNNQSQVLAHIRILQKFVEEHNLSIEDLRAISLGLPLSPIGMPTTQKKTTKKPKKNANNKNRPIPLSVYNRTAVQNLQLRKRISNRYRGQNRNMVATHPMLTDKAKDLNLKDNKLAQIRICAEEGDIETAAKWLEHNLWWVVLDWEEGEIKETKRLKYFQDHLVCHIFEIKNDSTILELLSAVWGEISRGKLVSQKSKVFRAVQRFFDERLETEDDQPILNEHETLPIADHRSC